MDGGQRLTSGVFLRQDLSLNLEFEFQLDLTSEPQDPLVPAFWALGSQAHCGQVQLFTQVPRIQTHGISADSIFVYL